jgi:hypothetical protein
VLHDDTDVAMQQPEVDVVHSGLLMGRVVQAGESRRSTVGLRSPCAKQISDQRTNRSVG